MWVSAMFVLAILRNDEVYKKSEIAVTTTISPIVK